jgi:hypothetical protein
MEEAHFLLHVSMNFDWLRVIRRLERIAADLDNLGLGDAGEETFFINALQNLKDPHFFQGFYRTWNEYSKHVSHAFFASPPSSAL